VNSISREVAIVGVGLTPQGNLPGSTNLSLQTDAFALALADSGLAKTDIDGLLSEPGTTDMHWALDYLRLARALGINPSYTGSFAMGGATAGNLVQLAAMAVSTGMANYVACCFGDAAKTGKKRPLFAAGGYLGTETANNSAWGAFGAATWSGLTASRHMALYGTTSEQLGEVAVAARGHAALNPAAMMRTPITLADHQASRMIVEPFHLLDCCLVSDGGACLIVTTTERARDLAQPVVSIAGMGQGFISQDHESEQWWYGPHQRDAMDRAYAMAGLGPQDVDVAELYDNCTPGSARRARAVRSSRTAGSGSGASCPSIPTAVTCRPGTRRAGGRSPRASSSCAVSPARARCRAPRLPSSVAGGWS
jgi:acetyl-CoA acetyltransferase